MSPVPPMFTFVLGALAATTGWLAFDHDPQPRSEVRVEKVVCVIPTADHTATECRQVRP